MDLIVQEIKKKKRCLWAALQNDEISQGREADVIISSWFR